MVLENEVLVKIKGNNKISEYAKKGYDVSSDFIVNVEDLLPTSGVIVKAKCDFCGTITSVKYKNYIRNFNRGNNFSCSKFCSMEKTKATNLLKYGSQSPMKSNEIKMKRTKTNMERYGVENYFSSEIFKNNQTKYNLEKYGFENVFGSEEIKEKIRKTNLEKYGVDNPFKSEEIKDKIKKTNLEKYGVLFYVQTDNFNVNNKLKIKETNFIKYQNGNKMRDEKYRKKFNICSDPNYISYETESKMSFFNCELGHVFLISSDNYRHRINNNVKLCTICYPIGNSPSVKEQELCDFIKSIYSGEVIQSYRDGLEIDIYLPDLKIGFEFNGLYWHSEIYKDRMYHLNKSNYFKEKGIEIMHIWEDDWDFKKEIVKSMILNKLGKSIKIYARNCEIMDISDNATVKDFLNKNHIQGEYYNFVKSIGLFFNGELVSVMAFDQFEGRKKMQEGEWNLSRFSNITGHSITGGASKILKYFIDRYTPTRLISYADRNWSSGGLYEKLGFDKVHETNPDYKYIVDGIRKHKSGFRKSRIGISESQIDLHKIWDCGKIKYQLKINNF